MGRLSFLGKVLFLAILFGMLVACGPSKPTGADYVGQWRGVSPGIAGCRIYVSAANDGYLVNVRSSSGTTLYFGNNCLAYEGPYTMTPEGTLKGGQSGKELMSVDREHNRALISNAFIEVSMVKVDVPEQPPSTVSVNPLVGTWKKVTKKGGQMLTDVLIIETMRDGTLRIREKEVMDNTEFRNVVYRNGAIEGILHMAVDSKWTTPFVIKISGKNTITYSDQRGEESFIKAD